MLNCRKADIRINHLSAFYWNFPTKSTSSTITVTLVFEQASNNQKLSVTSVALEDHEWTYKSSPEVMNLTSEVNGTSIVKSMNNDQGQIKVGDFTVFRNPLRIVCKSNNAAAIQELQVKISGDLTSNDCFVYRQEPT